MRQRAALRIVGRREERFERHARPHLAHAAEHGEQEHCVFFAAARAGDRRVDALKLEEEHVRVFEPGDALRAIDQTGERGNVFAILRPFVSFEHPLDLGRAFARFQADRRFQHPAIDAAAALFEILPDVAEPGVQRGAGLGARRSGELRGFNRHVLEFFETTRENIRRLAFVFERDLQLQLVADDAGQRFDAFGQALERFIGDAGGNARLGNIEREAAPEVAVLVGDEAHLFEALLQLAQPDEGIASEGDDQRGPHDVHCSPFIGRDTPRPYPRNGQPPWLSAISTRMFQRPVGN